MTDSTTRRSPGEGGALVPAAPESPALGDPGAAPDGAKTARRARKRSRQPSRRNLTKRGRIIYYTRMVRGKRICLSTKSTD